MSDTHAADLIKDVQSMFACVLRMHLDNEAVAFWSASREFRVLLRNDPQEAGTVAFELCIVPDSDDEDDEDEDMGVSKVLDMELDGYYEDDGMFVVEAFTYPLDELSRDPTKLESARARVNRVHGYAVCKCRQYFVKDQAKACLFCQLTADPVADAATHFCAICRDEGPAKHMVTQACCNQMLHRSCLGVWVATSKSGTCPLCRRESRPARHAAAL